MNAKNNAKLFAAILGLISVVMTACTTTGGGTATIDPPAPPLGLPDPPPVTVPTP